MILEICEKALWVFDFMYAYWKTWRRHVYAVQMKNHADAKNV